MTSDRDRQHPRLTGFTVVDGVEPISEAGFAGVHKKVDTNLAGPYLRLLVIVLALIITAGFSGPQSMQDTVVFSVLAVVVTAVIILLPALVRRMGEQPEGRAQKPGINLDIVSLSISSERLVVARARRSGLDIDDRLRPRLRQDLEVLLRARYGLDLDNPRHGDRITSIIGEDAYHIVRMDRAPTPVWDGMRRGELDQVLQGCLRAAVDPTNAEPPPRNAAR